MKVGSLFAGIGGIELGLRQAGFDTVWANEIDKSACETFRLNFPQTSLLECDVRKLDPYALEKVDIISAGFPCQPFSVCGKLKGLQDARGNMFFEIMRIADVIEPLILFLENVANLEKHDNGRTFNIIYNELLSRGYHIRYMVADACDYGVPQHRTRIYILAFKNTSLCQSYKFPEKSRLKYHVFDLVDKAASVDRSYYLPEDSAKYNKMLNAITDENQVYRFSDFGIQAGKDGISFTLKANMGTWYDRVPMIKDNFGIRALTPYECLRLMGFPKTFKLADIPLREQYKQIGNSVCVPVIKQIAKNLFSLIASVRR